jgi:hypothetical protein
VKRAGAVVFLILATAAPAAAQYRVVEAPPAPAFLSRFDFHLSAAALASGDEQFMWDTHWGGDFDLVDYVIGRMTFSADFQAVLGGEFQPFDPNQGNYTLTASSSVHRPKTFGIAWNVLGVRVLKDLARERLTTSLRTDVGVVTQRAHMDYRWIANLDIVTRMPLSPRFGWFGRLYGDAYGVTKDIAGRSGQQGGGIEAGVRLGGSESALEFFVGYGKVVDANAIDRLPGQWGFAGFRLLSD